MLKEEVKKVLHETLIDDPENIEFIDMIADRLVEVCYSYIVSIIAPVLAGEVVNKLDLTLKKDADTLECTNT